VFSRQDETKAKERIAPLRGRSRPRKTLRTANPALSTDSDPIRSPTALFIRQPEAQLLMNP